MIQAHLFGLYQDIFKCNSAGITPSFMTLNVTQLSMEFYLKLSAGLPTWCVWICAEGRKTQKEKRRLDQKE